MSHVENDLDIYKSAGNANTKRKRRIKLQQLSNKACFKIEIDLYNYRNSK